jgi:hypothetical protein
MRGLSSFEKRLAKLKPDTDEKSFSIPDAMFAESMRLIAETIPGGLGGKLSREVEEVIDLLFDQ